MSNKIFIIIVFTTFSLFILFVSLFNYIIDPGYIYFKKNSDKTEEYIAKLFSSDTGIVAKGWNERLLKSTMSRKAGDFDCVILGSSHIMEISEIRNTGNIQSKCTKLLNLGVSGGSFEDLFIFSELILTNNIKPKKIFIGIDPWTLKLNMDTRYQINILHYDSLKAKLENIKKTTDSSNYKISLAKNLFTLEYFIASIKNAKSTFEEVTIEVPKTQYTYENGYNKPLYLPDGSYLYDFDYILKSKNEIQTIKLGGGDYKISGKIYDENALFLFHRLIEFYQKNEIEVNLIITPYHPNVFKIENSKPVQHIKAIEEIVIMLANEYKLNLYGSFYPKKIGCKDDEFFDFMHASQKCLDRINFEN